MSKKEFAKKLYEFRVKEEKEDERHRKAILKIQNERRAIQTECSHKNTIYHPDPSGNNDSYHECTTCGKEF